jgi:hypothetical protein
MEKGNQQSLRVRVDGYTQVCLTAIAVLLTVLVLGLWADAGRLSGQAMAQEQVSRENRYTPRSVLQLDDLVAQQQQTNQKLEQILVLLESGKVKVQVVGGAAETAPQPQPQPPPKPEAAHGVIKITPQP